MGCRFPGGMSEPTFSGRSPGRLPTREQPKDLPPTAHGPLVSLSIKPLELGYVNGITRPKSCAHVLSVPCRYLTRRSVCCGAEGKRFSSLP